MNIRVFPRMLSFVFAFLLSIPFFVANDFLLPLSTIRVTAWAVGIIALFVIFLFWIFRSATVRIELNSVLQHPVVICYAAFLAWLTVRSAFVWSEYTWWGTWARGDGLWMQWSWLIVLIIAVIWHRVSPIVFSKILMYAVSILITTTIISRFGATGVQSDRWSGFVGNPLYFSALVLFIPWFAYAASAQIIHKTHRKFFITSMLIVTGLLLYFSGSRGALVAAAAGVFIWAIARVANQKYRVIIFVFMTLYVFFGYKYFLIADRSSTIYSRLALWSAARDEFKNRPIIGYGFGEHLNVISHNLIPLFRVMPSEQVTDTTHSLFIDVALAGGLVALTLLALWIFFSVRSINALGIDDRGVALATFFAYLFFGISFIWSPWSQIFLLFILVPIIAKTLNITKNNNTSFIFFLVMIIIFCSSVFVILTLPVQAAVGYRAAINPQQMNDATGMMPFSRDRDGILARQFAKFLDAQNEGVIGQDLLARFELRAHERETLVADRHAFAVVFFKLAQKSAAHQNLYALAEESLRACLVQSIDRPASVFQLAIVLFSEGRFTESLDLLKKFRDIHADIPEAFIFYGLLADVSGKSDEAHVAAQQAVVLRPLDAGWDDNYLLWLKDILGRHR